MPMNALGALKAALSAADLIKGDVVKNEGDAPLPTYGSLVLNAKVGTWLVALRVRKLGFSLGAASLRISHAGGCRPRW